MQDFEKLGAFYLGKRVDPAEGQPVDELLLYDSKDLTTHAAIIGMTGSGKTGLGISLIEEAAMDRIPVIAVDPKGDLGNLLLTFPELEGRQFEPWVDPRAVTESGQSVEAYAAQQAAAWKQGLADWGQDGDRIARLRATCDFRIYTPGGSAGEPMAVLGEFSAPSPEVRADRDLYNDLLEGAATGVLTLLGIEADPLSSREHILLANILRSSWDIDKSLDLAGLIAAIQTPPFSKIGVVDIENFYPARERFKFAMQINNLLAAPGFEVWCEGQPLNIDQLLYTESGQPRVAVLSIAHLDDTERMFFMTMLLNAVLAWMRKQSGSTSLRALLYIDELFGYMPPVANPPSKRALLTLLKQARAFGLGLALSTQNPVDLDYKGMSNIGTWFIGRLQTERDKARVLEGLQGAADGAARNSDMLRNLLSNLGKRQFLLHNVHESAPVLFATRWAMSYLSGPLTREQITRLTHDGTSVAPQGESPLPQVSKVAGANAIANTNTNTNTNAPVLEPGILQKWLPLAGTPGESRQVVCSPGVLAYGSISYTSARYNIDCKRSFAFMAELQANDAEPRWSDAEALAPDTAYIDSPTADAAVFGDCPVAMCQVRNYAEWEKAFIQYLRLEQPLTIYKSAVLKLTSQPLESERDFRIRLQQKANEDRDAATAALRGRYEAKLGRLEQRLLRARQALQREEEQASGSKMDTALSVGTALLGALLGRKRISVTSATRAGAAARRAGNMRKQIGDVKRAEETVESIQQEIDALSEELDAEVAAMADTYNAQSDKLEEISIRAGSSNIRIDFFGIGWQPHTVAL